MQENSHAFFANTACRYYPCHEGETELNCLFCFCPLYMLPACPGTPAYIQSEGSLIKDCSSCTFPHKAENYEKIIACLRGR